jgi:citrate lyase subunit beta-like protein
VTPHKKAEARQLVRRALDLPAPERIRERAVRINSVESGLALADLTEVVSSQFRLTVLGYFFLSEGCVVSNEDLNKSYNPQT